MRRRQAVLLAAFSGLVLGVVVGRVSNRDGRASQPLPVLGPTTLVRLVGHDLRLAARVDTGAEATSIHCPNSAITPVDSGDLADPESLIGELVDLNLVDDEGRTAVIRTEVLGLPRVRNADGQVEPRFEIRLPLEVEGVERQAFVTLNDRSTMRYRVLLGRDFLRDAFVVDVSGDPNEP